ncbi:MAG: CPBP family intramembrane metalloprotease, partial [Nitrospirae bacterium]
MAGRQTARTPGSGAGTRLEGLLLWAAITALLAWAPWPPRLRPYLPSLWIDLPLISLLLRREPLTAWGVRRPDARQTAAHLTAFALLLLPASLALLAALGAIQPRWDLHPGRLAATLGRQLLWVALPEELFFRGYLWARLRPQRPEDRLAAIAANGALFALTHLAIHPGPWAAATWLPGCYFAWLRCRTRNLLPPLLVHA